MLRVACVGCGAEFPCSPSFRGRAPKCPGCRPPTHGRRRDATAAARSAPQNGAAGAPQPSHMTPCACHCAACRAAGHGDGACVVLCAGLHALFDGKADVADLVLRHYYGACSWGTARFDARIQCVQYGPGLGDVIAAGASDGRIHFICAQTGEKILCPLRGHNSEVMSVSWSPDGTRLASGSLDARVLIWDAASGEQLCSLNVDAGIGGVQSVSFSPSGDMVAAGCYNGKIHFMDAAAGQIKSSVSGKKPINCVAFSPDGSLIAAGDGYQGFGSGEVRIYNASTGDPVGSPLTGHTHRVTGVCFDPTGKTIVSCSWDKTIRFWDSATGAAIGSPVKVDGDVRSIDFAPCGNKFAIACNNYNSSSYSVQIFSQEGSTGNFACQSTLWRLYFVLGA